MQEKTRQEYRRLATHFYVERLEGEAPTPRRVVRALEACAGEYRPAYWRRLRGALALAQEEAGHPEAAQRVRATKNPVTRAGSPTAPPPKQRRARGVRPDDSDRLVQHLRERGDHHALAVLTVVQATGCRPAEVAGLRVSVSDGTVTITGAKGRNDRGVEQRRLQLPFVAVSQVAAAMETLAGADDVGREVRRVQDRVARAGRRLWPRRAVVPSLYSWRHQMGSDLKGSGMDRVTIAYVMGHRATSSVDVYGDRRASSGRRALPQPAAGADMTMIREDHTAAPSGKMSKRQGNQRRADMDSPGLSL